MFYLCDHNRYKRLQSEGTMRTLTDMYHGIMRQVAMVVCLFFKYSSDIQVVKEQRDGSFFICSLVDWCIVCDLDDSKAAIY
jgi:hypothetical protein